MPIGTIAMVGCSSETEPKRLFAFWSGW